MVDKNKAMVDYIKQCDTIRNNKLFFNFINVGDNNKIFTTIGQDVVMNNNYIDGSIGMQYQFSIIDFRSLNDLPIIQGKSHENIDELLDVQGIIDWINEQEEDKNYPNFGTDCVIQEIRCSTNNPVLNGIDNSLSPNLAKYSVTIIVEYIDNSKKIWNKEGGSL